MNRLFAALAPLLALAASASAIASAAADTPGEAALRRHIVALAGDAMTGRKPGTPGADLAVRYIAEQFGAVGLVPGAPDGGWYAPVALIERKPISATATWRVGARTFEVASGDMVLRSREAVAKLANAPLIFAGYAISDPTAGIANLDGVNVTGAVVLMLPGAPEGLTGAPLASARREALIRAGAAAVIVLVRQQDDWPASRDNLRGGMTTLADGFTPTIDGALALDAWRQILAPDGDPASAIAAAADPAFRARRLDASVTLEVRTEVRPYRSWNVIGRLGGTEPGAGALLYLAHWDHLGICRPEGAADRICNGAVDNASGVAMLIEVARGLAKAEQPKRDMLFIATTAEEMGLLGAKALAARPPVPLASIAAVLNFDTVAIGPKGTPVFVLGRGMTPLDARVDSVARKLGRTSSSSTAANALISRQDGWAFTQAGVPAVMVGQWLDMPLLEAFLEGPYHQAEDDLSRALELGGAAQDVELHVALGRILGDPARFPGRAR